MEGSVDSLLEEIHFLANSHHRHAKVLIDHASRNGPGRLDPARERQIVALLDEIAVLSDSIASNTIKIVSAQNGSGKNRDADLRLERELPALLTELELRSDALDTNFDDISAVHDARNKILLQRLRHVKNNYVELCTVMDCEQNIL